MSDYIDRETAISLADELQIKEIKGYEQYNQAVLNYSAELLNLPTTDVCPVVHGKWVINNGRWRCNKCSCQAIVIRSPYCPNCGAQMDGDDVK